MAWLMQRRVPPAASLTCLRALNFISLVRNQSVGSSDGAPLISATLVSLSRKTSLNQLAYFRLSRLCSAGLSAGFQPARPTARRISTKPMWRVSSRRKWVWTSMMNWSRSEAARASARSGLLRLGLRHAEDGAVDLVHRQEGGGHAGGGGQEAAARAVLPGADLVGHGLDAGFDLALLRRSAGWARTRRRRPPGSGSARGTWPPGRGAVRRSRRRSGSPSGRFPSLLGRAWRRFPAARKGGRTTALRPLPVPAHPEGNVISRCRIHLFGQTGGIAHERSGRGRGARGRRRRTPRRWRRWRSSSRSCCGCAPCRSA